MLPGTSPPICRTLPCGWLLCREPDCPGQWVLLTAMQRIEAGALHALGGRPDQTSVGDFPWKITVDSAPEPGTGSSAVTEIQQAMPEDTEEMLRQNLSFRYPHLAATQAPSKQTATDRKGRVKDAEAAEDTRQSYTYLRKWRKPSFITQTQDGRAYGNAIHGAMQYIRYEACGSLAGVEEEIRRLCREGFLSREQGELVDCGAIARFFETELGKKLASGGECLREPLKRRRVWWWWTSKPTASRYPGSPRQRNGTACRCRPTAKPCPGSMKCPSRPASCISSTPIPCGRYNEKDASFLREASFLRSEGVKTFAFAFCSINWNL